MMSWCNGDITHLCGPRGAEECEKISALHELKDDEMWMMIEADSEEADDVLMFEVAHEQRLL